LLQPPLQFQKWQDCVLASIAIKTLYLSICDFLLGQNFFFVLKTILGQKCFSGKKNFFSGKNFFFSGKISFGSKIFWC